MKSKIKSLLPFIYSVVTEIWNYCKEIFVYSIQSKKITFKKIFNFVFIS